MRLLPARRARHIEPLATLPLFHKLDGRRVLVAGGTEGALWKAELLAAAGARVTVLAEQAGAAFGALATDPPNGAVEVVRRTWQAGDFADAVLAVGDFTDEAAAATFSKTARAAGVPVNLVDRPALSDFQFGAIVNRSPLVLAISTDGGAPVFAQTLRTQLEALLPRALAGWAEAARRWRARLKARSLSPAQRRRFWQDFATLAWRERTREPDEVDYLALLHGLDGGRGSAAGGRCRLIGAGPGDPELLTLKALRALQAASVVVYEAGLPPAVLELARREAQRIACPPAGQRHALVSDLATRIRRGEEVVLLAEGDGQSADSALPAALRAAGLDVEFLPGVAAQCPVPDFRGSERKAA